MIGSWISRFGLTWAAGMVLVTAGIQSFIDSTTPARQALGQGPAAHSRLIEVERLMPRARTATDSLHVELMGRQDGDAVAVRVSGCTDDDVELTRHGVRFPVTVQGVDADETCVLQARRRDGRFWTSWTEPVRVQGADTIGLELPEDRAGGIGLLVSRRHQGAYIDRVERHSPADRAGLERGDIVSHVDGRALSGMSIDTMVESITGPEGTRIDLSVIDVRTGRTVRRTIERQYMASPDFRYE